jgi:hypothetical protein
MYITFWFGESKRRWADESTFHELLLGVSSACRKGKGVVFWAWSGMVSWERSMSNVKLQNSARTVGNREYYDGQCATDPCLTCPTWKIYLRLLK